MACGVLTDWEHLTFIVGGSSGGQTTATDRVFRYNPVTTKLTSLLLPGRVTVTE